MYIGNRLFIFDLDGTLIDSVADLAAHGAEGEFIGVRALGGQGVIQGGAGRGGTVAAAALAGGQVVVAAVGRPLAVPVAQGGKLLEGGVTAALAIPETS